MTGAGRATAQPPRNQAALRLVIMGLVLGFGVPAPGLTAPAHADPVHNKPDADPVARWHAPIAESAKRFGIPIDWIERVMRAESGGRNMLGRRPITSSAGAMGLMQLMPGTWGQMRARLGLGDDPHDPRDNILAGTFYLRLMYDRFGYPGLFAAYNAGPGRYARHLATAQPLPAETRAYMATLTGGEQVPIQVIEPPVNNLFFALRSTMPRASDTGGPSAPNLFVELRDPTHTGQ